MDKVDLGHEAEQAAILDKINSALQELGSTSKWIRAPDFFPEYESLRNKKIVMVDDVINVLENYAPDLLVATDGKANFIHYNNETLDELVKKIISMSGIKTKIIAHNPNIVLLDYHLSRQLTGSQVAMALKKHFSGDIVGFSSDETTNKNFTEAGVKGCVDKGSATPEQTIQALGKLMA